MNDELQSKLVEAYHLIRSGQRKTALDILQALVKKYPDSVDAWWLVANALSDPDGVRVALQKILLIDPFHEQAQQKLDKINATFGAHSLGTFTSQPFTEPIPVEDAAVEKSAKLPASKSTSGSQGLGVLAVVMAVLILVSLGGAMVILQNKENDTPAAVVQVPSPTTVLMNALGTPITPTASSTYTPTVTKTPLPATWTLSPTFTTVFIPSSTPWFVKPTIATADPSLFGDTYWDGIGDGFTLETYTRSGGRHLRFYEFPVKIWLDAPLDPIWTDAVNHAVQEIGQVVPLEMVNSDAEATISILVLDPSEYERWSGCPQLETAGCARILDLGDIAGGDTYHRIVGQVWVSTYSQYPRFVVMHELLHALGVMVHSPYETDVMYPIEANISNLSQRDLNTLWRLYANPSYAD